MKRQEIVTHFRDLFNLNEFIDFDNVMTLFCDNLKKAGYTLKSVQNMKTQGAKQTKYEKLIKMKHTSRDLIWSNC